MPGHFGGSHSHGDKKSNNRTSSNNNRESYRTSTSYQKSVSPSRIKSSKKEYELAVGKSRLDNLKVKKVPAGFPFSTILNAGQKFRQKTLDRNVEYFKGLKSRGKATQYELTDEGYKEYIRDRSAGKIDAAGNINPNFGRDNGGNQSTQPIIVERNIGGSTVQTTEAKLAEEKAESEEYDARKTKRRGRRRTILTSQTGATGNLQLGKRSLLGV
jgi:hypothetical protein